MLQPSLTDVLLFGSAGVFGWIVVDGCANLLLRTDERGAKFRFIGARWLKRDLVIKIALLQFLIAFIVQYFIVDYFYFLFSEAYQYILPISMMSLGSLYLYILANLPYKITVRRCTFSIVLFVLAGILFYAISQLT